MNNDGSDESACTTLPKDDRTIGSLASSLPKEVACCCRCRVAKQGNGAHEP